MPFLFIAWGAIALWWASWGAYVIAAAYIIAALVVYSINRDRHKPLSPNSVNDSHSPLGGSNTFGFDNFVNQISKEYPLSIIYGKYKHAGNRFYTEIAGSDNNNNILEVCIGIGEGEIDSLVDPDNNLKLNDIPWKNIISSRSYTLHTGTKDQTVDGRIIQSSITFDDNTIIPESNSYVYTGKLTDTEYMAIGLMAPYGLYKTNNGYSESHSIHYTIYYRLFGTTTWHPGLTINPPDVNDGNNKVELTECNYLQPEGDGQWICTPPDPDGYYTCSYVMPDPPPLHCGRSYTGWSEYSAYQYAYPPELTYLASISSNGGSMTQYAVNLQTALNSATNVGTGANVGSTYTVSWNNSNGELIILSNLAGHDGQLKILHNEGYESAAHGRGFIRQMGRESWDVDMSQFSLNSYPTGGYKFYKTKKSYTAKTFSALRWEERIQLPAPGRYEFKIVNLIDATWYDSQYYTDAFAVDYFNEYSTQSYAFPHTAYLALTMTANEQIGGGVPNIVYVVKGLKIKNWDTGVTEWTDNPVWCLIDFMTNKRYGLGGILSINDIDLTAAIESADYCDELIDNGNGGTEKRHILNIVIDFKTEPKEILSLIGQTCNMSILYVNGKIKIKIDRPRVPVMSFNMDNIIKESFIVKKTSWSESRTNRISVQYQDEDNYYEREFVPIDDDLSQIKIGIVEKSINGYGITKRSQASRLAQFNMNMSKGINTVVSFKCGLKNLFAEVMDNVLISHDVSGWVNKEFTIVVIEEEENEEMSITAIEYNDEVYNLTATATVPPNDSTLPNPETSTPHVRDLRVTEQLIVGLSGDISSELIVNWQAPENSSDTPFLNINKVEIMLSDNGGDSYASKGFVSYPANSMAITGVGEINDDNKVMNYSFEDDLGQWELITTTSGEGTLSRSTTSPLEGQYSGLISNITIIGNRPPLSGEAGRLLLRQASTFSITKDNVYGLGFKAKTQSGETRPIYPAIINSYYTAHYNDREKVFILGENWRDYNLIFKALDSKSGEVSLAFFLGQSDKDVYLDSIRLHETGLYKVKALAYNEAGKPATAWNAPTADIVVIGKQIPPAQVANFSGGEYGDTIVLKWDDLSQTEYDLAGYEIRRGSTWNSAIIIDTNIVGTKYTVTSYRNGTQRYWIKAIDTSGNYSLIGSYIQINAVNAPIANIIYTRNELQHTSEATFSNTEMVWHEITAGDYKKCLALQTTDLYDEAGDTWDSSVIYDTPIRTSGTYTTGTIDSLRLSTAQITLDMDTAYLITGGGVSVSYEIRTSEDNIVWSGWQTFAEGNYTFRYFQFRITWAGNGLNNLFIYKLILDIDVPEFVLRGRETIVTASAGASFTYSSAFIALPTLSVTVIGSTALIPIVTAESTTGATVKLKNLSDVDSTGVFDWTATGY